MSVHTIHMSDCASAFMISRPNVAQQALQTLSGGVLTVSVCTVHNSLHASGLSDLTARLSTYACCIATQQPSGSCTCCSSQHDSTHLTCLLACSSGLPNRALLNKWPAGGDVVFWSPWCWRPAATPRQSSVPGFAHSACTSLPPWLHWMHCKRGSQSGECLLLVCGTGVVSGLMPLLYVHTQSCCTCTFRLAVQCAVHAPLDLMHTCW